MENRLFALAILLCATSLAGRAQTIVHPWHVVDNGGGRATGGGITLEASTGQPEIATMSAAGTNLESGYIPGLREFSGTSTTLTSLVSDGWNLLSLPVIPADSHKTALYPSATSSAFRYSNGYVTQTILDYGVGYWLKFPSAASIPITGTTIQQDSIPVSANWNMIGVLSSPVPLPNITPIGTSVISNYFAYTAGSGYVIADTLEPGAGYWVKAATAGELSLRGASILNPQKTILQSVPKKTIPGRKTLAGVKSMEGIEQFTVTDAGGSEATLFFSSARKDIDPARYEMPPPPPEGSLDVRFGSNRMLEIADAQEAKEVPIRVLSARYPLVIRWDAAEMPTGASLVVDGKRFEMRTSPQTQITHPTSHIALSISPSSVLDLPKTFALQQNYPNPFNPTTIIKYDLPTDAHVTLKIYNALGQEVRTVRDEVENAGFRSVEWNGTNNEGSPVASGVYFYRIQAIAPAVPGKSFVDVKKMMLLR